MSISELQLRKRELEKKLTYLSEDVTYENYEVKNSDVYFHTETGTRGSYDERKKIIEEIEEIDREITRIERASEQHSEDMKRYMEEKKAREAREREEAKLAKEQEKQVKKAKFKELKKLYKNGPLLNRILNRVIIVRGLQPNWREVKKLSSEELDFLINLRSGNTLRQKDSEEHLEERLNNQGKSYREIRNSIQNSRWDEFNAALASKTKLKNKMELDESLAKGGHHI